MCNCFLETFNWNALKFQSFLEDCFFFWGVPIWPTGSFKASHWPTHIICNARFIYIICFPLKFSLFGPVWTTHSGWLKNCGLGPIPFYTVVQFAAGENAVWTKHRKITRNAQYYLLFDCKHYSTSNFSVFKTTCNSGKQRAPTGKNVLNGHPTRIPNGQFWHISRDFPTRRTMKS